jgi:small subunit ribosomal protein S6
MRKYELVCIIHPDLEEAAFNSTIDKIKGWIGESGGSVDKVDVWGRRSLAYPIRKQRQGQYVLLNITIPTTAITVLERNLRFMEPVIRHMLTSMN